AKQLRPHEILEQIDDRLSKLTAGILLVELMNFTPYCALPASLPEEQEQLKACKLDENGRPTCDGRCDRANCLRDASVFPSRNEDIAASDARRGGGIVSSRSVTTVVMTRVEITMPKGMLDQGHPI